MPLLKHSLLYALYACQEHPEGPCLSRRAAFGSCLRERFFRELPRWNLYKTASPFNRRVTCIEWHPSLPNRVAYGSHSGDVYLWNLDDASQDQIIFVKGLACGIHSITDMAFHPYNLNLIYTTSVDGRFCTQDFTGRHSAVLLDTMNLCHWWCCVALCREHDLIFVGGNGGNAVCLDSDGKKVADIPHLHKGKIKFAQFCPARDSTLVTASVDHTVALWDVRMLTASSSNKPKPMTVMEHGAPVNSAYFDPIQGNRILTTAQNSELRVYDVYRCAEGPTVVVSHPHRHFQHMTDIRATWHPLYENTCIVGRYAAKEDSDQTRCVDVIDLESGSRVGAFYSPHLTQIIQVSKMRDQGDLLASGMGYTAAVWRLSSESGASIVAALKRIKRRRIGNGGIGGGEGGGDGASGYNRRRGDRKHGGDSQKKKEQKSIWWWRWRVRRKRKQRKYAEQSTGIYSEEQDQE